MRKADGITMRLKQYHPPDISLFQTDAICSSEYLMLPYGD